MLENKNFIKNNSKIEESNISQEYVNQKGGEVIKKQLMLLAILHVPQQLDADRRYPFQLSQLTTF